MTSLDRLVRGHPELAPAADVLRILATALPETTLPADTPHLPASEARLAAGIPALEGELLLDGATLWSNVGILAGALGRSLEPMVQLDVAALAAASLARDWDVVSLVARAANLDDYLLLILVDHAARPALRAGARAVRELVDQCRWDRAMCPCCGAPPMLAELRSGSASLGDAEQQRVLRCGRCLAAWPFSRLRCTGCGESRHQELAYLHGPGEGVYRRAEICSTCGTYLKSVAVLAPLSLVELLELDLATVALDVAAVEQGHHR